MALGGEVHHHVRMLLLKQLVNGLPVADIRLHKAEMGLSITGARVDRFPA